MHDDDILRQPGAVRRRAERAALGRFRRLLPAAAGA
jgi:hypothetical protein